jgi:hypothetical protein
VRGRASTSVMFSSNAGHRGWRSGRGGSDSSCESTLPRIEVVFLMGPEEARGRKPRCGKWRYGWGEYGGARWGAAGGLRAACCSHRAFPPTKRVSSRAMICLRNGLVASPVGTPEPDPDGEEALRDSFHLRPGRASAGQGRLRTRGKEGKDPGAGRRCWSPPLHRKATVPKEKPTCAVD